MQVDVVERGLDLVHQVEGRRAAAEHGEQEGEGHQGPLAAGQQGQPAHVAARRADLDLDPGVERFSGSVRDSRPVPPGNREVIRLEKCSLTSAKAESKTCMISSSSARMTWRSSRRALRTSSTWDSRNWWRSPSSDSSSRASGLTGPRRPSSASSCCRPGSAGSTPSGSSGAGAPWRVLGARSRAPGAGCRRPTRAGWSPRPGRVGLGSRLRAGGQLVLVDRPLAAEILQPRAPPARTASSWRRWRSRRADRSESSLRLGLDHHGQQSLDGGGVGLEPAAPLGGLLALLGVAGQAALDLGQALGEHPAALVQAGRAHSTRRGPAQPRRSAASMPPALVAGRGRPARRPGPAPASRAGSRPRARRPGPASRPIAVVELGPVPADLLQLGGQRSLVARRPARRPTRAAWWADLVAVVGPDGLGGRPRVRPRPRLGPRSAPRPARPAARGHPARARPRRPRRRSPPRRRPGPASRSARIGRRRG